MSGLSPILAGTQRVPALREDLQLMRGAPDASGEPIWLIYDPVLHRYHELDSIGFAVLRAWRAGAEPSAIAEEARRQSGLAIDKADVEDLARTAESLELLIEPGGGWSQIHKRVEKSKPRLFYWLVHNYLYFRIPLARPQGFLTATLPIVRVLATAPFFALYIVVGLVGIYLASRQWEVFAATFVNSFSLEGVVSFFFAIVAVKTFHELGHAYVAVHYKCRVPTIGVAFMVLMPVLYTDVTDSWRLPSRRARLAIDAAGVAVELVIAAFALFFWSFLPDGTLKSAAFFVATGSIIASLVINLNPFMRFDGYYVLSDLLNVSNLQERSFALARWHMREVLFGLRAPKPDTVNERMTRGLIVFAYLTWLYRCILFIGIAVLVYVLTFKALGIILFVVEIIWFILLPIGRELQHWWQERERIMNSRRTYVSMASLLGLLALFVIPWSTRVEVPAVVEPRFSERLSAAIAGEIGEVNLAPGQKVKRGDVLLRLVSPHLESQIKITETQLELVKARLARRAADSTDLAQTMTLIEQRSALEEKLAGLQRRRSDLSVKAPEDGIIREVAPDLHVGRWIARREEIALIVSAGGLQARGYLPQDDIWRISAGDKALFVPENLLAEKLPAKVVEIDSGAANEIALPHLSSTYGGAVQVREDLERRQVPIVGQYPIRFSIERGEGQRDIVQRGTMLVTSKPESLFNAFFRRVVVTLVRESGF